MNRLTDLLKDDEENSLIPSLTRGTSEQIAPQQTLFPKPQIINQDNKQYEFTPGKNASSIVRREQTETGFQPKPSPPVAKAVKLPGMPPDVKLDEIERYLNKQKDDIGKYGAEDMINLSNKTIDDRNSLSNRATSGLKGFADAIMMGVAGAGNPGWQQSHDQSQDRMAAEKMDALKNANQANMTKVSTGMNIDRMDPKSPLSIESQNTYAPLFQKLGYPPNAIKNMSAASIDSAIQSMVSYGGAEMQARVKDYELQIERAKMAQMAGKEASQDELNRSRMSMDAAEKLLNAKEPGLLSKLNPFTSGKAPEAEQAKKHLTEIMTGGMSDLDKEALDWANQNPNDPRAAKIKARLNK